MRVYLDQDATRFAVLPYGQGDAGKAWQTIFELAPVQSAPNALRFGKMSKDGSAQAFGDAGPDGRCMIESMSVRTPLVGRRGGSGRECRPKFRLARFRLL